MMATSLLLPITLILLASACLIEIVRDVAFKRYGKAMGGLLWGLIFLVATMMSFGPLLAVHVYDDADWRTVLTQMESVAPYALTGAVFATDRSAVLEASQVLRFAAGNFYINDKPTGAVVGQQPFGGARASGTNDKAGSLWNLVRWVSPRSIKETFEPPTDHRYPHMG